jgi:hypothetical protein
MYGIPDGPTYGHYPAQAAQTRQRSIHAIEARAGELPSAADGRFAQRADIALGVAGRLLLSGRHGCSRFGDNAARPSEIVRSPDWGYNTLALAEHLGCHSGINDGRSFAAS